MPDKVVDASALAALAFAEPRGESVGVRIEGHTLHAPSLLRYELTSIARKKLLTAPDRRDAILDQFSAARGLRISWHEVDSVAVLDLAISTGLTAYDAAYLWLARALGADLITLDRSLAEAARR